jgi:hypothetical protein
MLSRDRLNMDLEKSSLNLMLRLLEVDNQENDGGMTAAGNRFISNRSKNYDFWVGILTINLNCNKKFIYEKLAFRHTMYSNLFI